MMRFGTVPDALHQCTAARHLAYAADGIRADSPFHLLAKTVSLHTFNQSSRKNLRDVLIHSLWSGFAPPRLAVLVELAFRMFLADVALPALPASGREH